MIQKIVQNSPIIVVLLIMLISMLPNLQSNNTIGPYTILNVYTEEIIITL